jgi:hypothetical protein
VTLFPPVCSHLIATNRPHRRRHFWRYSAALCAASFDVLLVTRISGCGSFFKIRIQSEQFVGKSIPGSSRLPLADIHTHCILNIARFGRVWLPSFFAVCVKPSVCSAAPAGERAAFRPRPAHSRIYCGNSKAFQVTTKPPGCIARRVLLRLLPCRMRLS